jgi:hypothetical protein
MVRALPPAIVAGAYWLGLRYFDQQRIATYVESLRVSPGIVVTGVERTAELPDLGRAIRSQSTRPTCSDAQMSKPTTSRALGALRCA